MDFSSTWFFLVPLLATFSTGLPSPVEEDKAKPEDSGSNIYNINITIHCYFHSDSPECKDNPKEAADVRPSNDIDDGDTSNSSSENTVQEDGVNLEEASKIRDMYHMPPKEYKARVEEALPSQYETSSENNSYKDLESYSKLWQGRRITRDELCTSCLAIASDENFILDSSQQFGFRRKMIHKDGQQFVAVKTQLAAKKAELGMSLNRPVPFERGYEICSSVVHQILYERASQRLYALERADKADKEAKIEFYTRFLQHLEDDPSLMQCGPLEIAEFARLRTMLYSALEANL